MNERIKELLEQVGVKFVVMPDDTVYEKFAELIVRECIDINKQELAFNAFEKLLNRYQEHFGVEETRSQKMRDAGFTHRPKGWTKEEE